VTARNGKGGELPSKAGRVTGKKINVFQKREELVYRKFRPAESVPAGLFVSEWF